MEHGGQLHLQAADPLLGHVEMLPAHHWVNAGTPEQAASSQASLSNTAGGCSRYPPLFSRHPGCFAPENLVTSGHGWYVADTRPIRASATGSSEMSDTRTQYSLTSPACPSADCIAGPLTPHRYHLSHPTDGPRLQAPHQMPRHVFLEKDPCKDRKPPRVACVPPAVPSTCHCLP